MNEITLNCNSPCISCPIYDRVRKITSFKERNLPGAYYCSYCNNYALCRMGIAHRRNRVGKLVAHCTRCNRPLEKIILTYRKGQDEQPFGMNSLLVVRKPNGPKFIIVRTLKGSYFRDLAEVILYILFELGMGHYNIVEYNTVTKDYQVIYSGVIETDFLALKNVGALYESSLSIAL